MHRAKLTFNVRGENLNEIRERADKVVREFLAVSADISLDNAVDVEIEVEGTPAGEERVPPLPSYDFLGRVHVRIRQ